MEAVVAGPGGCAMNVFVGLTSNRVSKKHQEGQDLNLIGPKQVANMYAV